MWDLKKGNLLYNNKIINYFKNSFFIDDPLIIGHHDDYVSAIIVPDEINPHIVISSGRDK
jgi:hypothetical protein